MKNFKVHCQHGLFINIFILYLSVLSSAYVNNTYHEIHSNLTITQTATYQDETILILLSEINVQNDLTEVVLEFRVSE